MGKKKVLVSYGVDIDAVSQVSFTSLAMLTKLQVAGWLGSYGGEDSTSDISRGLQSLCGYQMKS